MRLLLACMLLCLRVYSLAAAPLSATPLSSNLNEDADGNILSGVELLRLFASQNIARDYYGGKNTQPSPVAPKSPKPPSLSANNISIFEAFEEAFKKSSPKTTTTSRPVPIHPYSRMLMTSTTPLPQMTTTSTTTTTTTTTTKSVPRTFVRPEVPPHPRFFSEDEAFGDKILGGDDYSFSEIINGGSNAPKVQVKISVSEQKANSVPDTSVTPPENSTEMVAVRKPKKISMKVRKSSLNNQPPVPDLPPVWSQPSIQWGEPSQMWSEPEQVWSQPSIQWGQPPVQWSQPSQQWGQPSLQWGQPPVDHNHPSTKPPRLYKPKNMTKDKGLTVFDENLHLTPEDAAMAQANRKFGYVVQGKEQKRYRLEEKTPEGFIVGEYGVLNNSNGEVRGVRYAADETINPKVIYEALMKFLSL